MSFNLSSAKVRRSFLLRVGLLATIVRTGNALVSILLIVGLSVSVGRLLAIASTLERTSLRALSILVPMLKLATTTETPSWDVAVTSRNPFTPETASSTLRETSVFTSSGEAPGYAVTTVTTPKVTSGLASFCMPEYDRQPSSTAATINIKINTGRVIADLVKPISYVPLSLV